MFALGLDAYVVAGLLGGIGHEFGSDVARSAQAVTAFTLSYAIAAPLLTAFFAGKSVRTILIVALSIFSAANAASALATSLTALIVARAIAGLGAGLFSPVAVAAATALVSPQRRGRAVGAMLGGISAGTVAGVPLGLLVNQSVGWRATLWLVTSIGMCGLLSVLFGFPAISVNTPPSLKKRFAMLTRGRVAATVSVTFLMAVGSLGLYTFIAPIVFSVSGNSVVTPYLWFWGIGGVLGSFTVGWAIDRLGGTGVLISFILFVLALALLSVPKAIIIGPIGYLSFIAWGAMGWSCHASQQHRLLALVQDQGATAVALNNSCNYLGSAVGAMCGGALISYGLTPAYLPYCAAAAAFAALVVHTISRGLFRASESLT
jgi:predicted MFS family arabinose efflux permease